MSTDKKKPQKITKIIITISHVFLSSSSHNHNSPGNRTSFRPMHLPDVIELGSRAQRRVDLVGVVEEGVVDLVLAGLLAERDYVLETVAPEDLRG